MYKLGTRVELEALKEELEDKLQPLVESQKQIEDIFQSVNFQLTILDENYGAERNWLEDDGGYLVIFTEVTQDDNEEMLALLEQYNQDYDCMEYDKILATVITDYGVVDWLSELYLMGTEYGVEVVRPRLRKRFDDRTPRYISRDVNAYLPNIFNEFLYRSIEKMRDKVALDYLQIFKLSLKNNKNGFQLELEHWQEQPSCKQKTYWEVPPMEGIFDFLEKWNGKKLYIIDDGVAITTVFPYER